VLGGGYGSSGGHNQTQKSCMCEATDVRCIQPKTNGGCAVCTTDERCADWSVQFGMHIFKLLAVDLKSSLLSFQAWVRNMWTDYRLSYNYQCYGGLDKFDWTAQAGVLGNSGLWVPDIELMNQQESIWGGSSTIGSRNAIIYSCSENLRDCGLVWWSRPGVVKALCNYHGLVKFPQDTLSCELEFTPWTADGRYHDVVPYGSGIGYDGDGSGMLAGISSGTNYQDYKLVKASVTRYIVSYPSTNQPHPTLVFKLYLRRSQDWYQLKLVMPLAMLTTLGFLALWMSPEGGERISYLMTVMLTIVLTDLTASTYLPICEEKLLFDYIFWICFIFAWVTLVETILVVNLWTRTDYDWVTAFIPRSTILWYRKLKTLLKRHRKIQPPTELAAPGCLKELEMRQFLEEVFATLDREKTGQLDIAQLGLLVTALPGLHGSGREIDDEHLETILEEFNTNGDETIAFPEFVHFCKMHFPIYEDIGSFRSIIEGYLRTTDLLHQATVKSWQSYARMIDNISRIVIPPGWCVSLYCLANMPESKLEEQIHSSHADQWWTKMRGLVILAVALILLIISRLVHCFRIDKHGRCWCHCRRHIPQVLRPVLLNVLDVRGKSESQSAVEPIQGEGSESPELPMPILCNRRRDAGGTVEKDRVAL